MTPFSYRGLHFTGLTADSRQVQPGFLYAALPGTRVNGLDFAPQALAAGALAILAPAGTALPGATVLQAEGDVRQAFAQAVALAYPAVPERVAAVTGTNGKTSIAHFTRQLLGPTAISAGTLGLQPPGIAALPPLTSPDPLSLFQALSQARARGYDRLVIEASSHGLDQRRLDGLRVNAAAFTNLTQDHLDYHGDMARYGAAKMALFHRLLAADGVALLNADDPFCAAQLEDGRLRQTRWSYGRAGHDLQLLDRRATPTGQELELRLLGAIHRLELPLIGSFQAHNLLAALGLAHALGEDLAALCDAVPALTPVPGRMETVPSPRSDLTLLVDYAHTPDALATVLTSARPHCTGRLLLLFGAGGDRDRGKRPLMGEVAARLADRAFVVDDNPRSEEPARIRADILAADPRLTELGERRNGIAAVLAQMQPGDCLVIAGKGHEDYQEIQGVRQPFDDRKITRALAEELWG